MFYDQPTGKVYDQNSPFVAAARIKLQSMELLDSSMTQEQKNLLEAYFDADTTVESIRQFDHFRYAFHLGAQLMEEIIAGKDLL